MLATVGTATPTDAGWVFEPKYDGIRVLAFANRGVVALVSRNGIDKTHSFPEIAEALLTLHKKVRKPFVLDGEIVVMSDGAPLRFQDLQRRMHVSDRTAIEGHRSATPAALIAFDILLDGKASLVTEPWRVRRKHLAALLQPPGRRLDALRLSDVGEDGASMMRDARDRAWEGIIAKRTEAPYEPGQRSRAWLKLKLERQQEFVVGGWTEPRRSREHLGALLLGYYDHGGHLIYAGHTGTGFTRQTLGEMSRRLSRIERKTSPFSTTPKTNESAHWTRPEIVVQVKFNEWTADGRLRQPVYLGTRDDKSARDVVREPESLASEAAPPAARARTKNGKRVAASTTRRGVSRAPKPSTRSSQARISRSRSAQDAAAFVTGAPDVVTALRAIEANGGDGALDLPTGTLEVTSLTKVFFPTSGHTKGDLMRFYAEISTVLLPAITDRPLVMKRFPNGVTGQAFYQQKAPAHTPAGVRVEEVADEGLETASRVIGGDLQTLLYLTQLGAISVDPWHSRVGAIQYADYAIIDLDPGPRAPFSVVVEVAHAVKDELDALHLHAVAKTSGASGMHIVVPLPAHVPNDGARMIAEIIAAKVAHRHPTIATIERAVKTRAPAAVYVDFLQNIRGKTVAGVYSVRAQSIPSVSTPLDWSEVNEDLDPTDFTVDTLPKRLAERGDLWAIAMQTPNTLAGIIGDA
ncbi:MAG TPA: DNA ligase D [Gemmatimonadaceae bacterium]